MKPNKHPLLTNILARWVRLHNESIGLLYGAKNEFKSKKK